ncbi:DUF6287 domain-containing protein [Streptococcaceae bacterium ESL0687]|nr:DUF6287 domain-containing protein [Streptococcaceae bacterium ESL0687]
MEGKIFQVLILVACLMLTACSKQTENTSSDSESSVASVQDESSKSSGNAESSSATSQATAAEDEEDLTGYYYAKDGTQALVKKIGPSQWRIDYGDVYGTFTTDLTWTNGEFYSKSPMIKSDGYQGFTVNIVKSIQDLTISLLDKNTSHNLVFANHKPGNFEGGEVDLNSQAIMSGDLTTLIGAWVNGKGEVLVINPDGTTSINSIIETGSGGANSKVPFVGLRSGIAGAALGLYQIGFENPDGDQSNTRRPRLIITQQGGNYPADTYYYRQ